MVGSAWGGWTMVKTTGDDGLYCILSDIKKFPMVFIFIRCDK